MNIIISNSSDLPIYEQIGVQIKQLIMKGELKEGDTLPSMRFLAKELQVSVITTKRAYEELEREGFIETMTGRGSFVAPRNVERFQEEQLRQIEGLMQKSITMAKIGGISFEELQEMLKSLYMEQK